ncbi:MULTISPECIES: hypothetical protein [unclassified Haloarcula]|nr:MULTISPECIES: hypothetical protein [unclassified Haloarcula]
MCKQITADTVSAAILEENAPTVAGTWAARKTGMDTFDESRQGGFQ